MRMADFKNLKVRQKAHELAIATYHASEQIKGSPATIIRDQLLRAVMSIGSNIPEGSAKRGDREFARCFAGSWPRAALADC